MYNMLPSFRKGIGLLQISFACEHESQDVLSEMGTGVRIHELAKLFRECFEAFRERNMGSRSGKPRALYLKTKLTLDLM